MAYKEPIEHGELEVLTPEETRDLMERGEAVLIDVRTPAEYAFEHIRGAILSPLSDFDPAYLPAQEGKRIILHCGSGMRSKYAADRMLQAGMHPVAHMEGGIMGWKRSRLPFIATDPLSGAPREVVSG
jgi:rhodanese-related sulfurtransferase